MKLVLPFYDGSSCAAHLQDDGGHVILSDLCKRCRAYETGECTWDRRDGVQRCKRGLTVFRHGEFYVFGSRVFGLFNNSIRVLDGCARVVYSVAQFDILSQLIELSYSADRMRDDMSRSDGLYSAGLRKIRNITRNNTSESAVESRVMTEEDSDAIRDAIDVVAAVRSEILGVREVLKLQEKYRAVFNDFHDDEVVASLDNIWGRVLEVEREFREWLHTEAQYIPGLKGVFNAVRLNVSSGPVSKEKLHTLDALAYAMDALRIHSFCEKKREVWLHLFKLFDRYHYCLLTQDVDWLLRSEGCASFFYEVRTVSGFEFVASNLLDNAVKYLPAERHLRKVSILFGVEKDGLTVTIKSYGPPRTEKELVDIWGAGNRGDPEKQKEYGIPGEGLGLPQVKKIIDDSYFVIDAKSVGDTIMSRGLAYKEFVVRIFIQRSYVRPWDA